MTRTIVSPKGKEARAHGRLYRLAVWRNPDIKLVNDARYDDATDEVIDVWHVCPKQRTPSWFWRAPRVRFPFWSCVLGLCPILRRLRLRRAEDWVSDLVWQKHWACVDIEHRRTWEAVFYDFLSRLRPGWEAKADEANAASSASAWRHQRAWGEGWTA